MKSISVFVLCCILWSFCFSQSVLFAQTGQNLPPVSAEERGFSIKSEDGSFELRLRALIHTDGQFFIDDEADAGIDQFLLRRGRLTFQGIVFKYIEFKIMPEFGDGRNGELYDAFMNFTYWRQASLQVGKFKAPVGLERLQSRSSLHFVEASLADNLIPNRDVGIQLHGVLAKGAVNYAIGIFNGVRDRGRLDNDDNDEKSVDARLFIHPFLNTAIAPLKGLGMGIAGSKTDKGSETLPTYVTSGRITFFRYTEATASKGEHYRITPQAYYYWGKIGLLTEYVQSSQTIHVEDINRQLDNSAWQLAGVFAVVGGSPSYKGFNPKADFDPRAGTWGALEVGVRVSEIVVDERAFPQIANPAQSARKARAWVVGMNWYLNRNVKAQLNYEQTEFEGGVPGGANRALEKVLMGRFQLDF